MFIHSFPGQAFTGQFSHKVLKKKVFLTFFDDPQALLLLVFIL